MKSFYTAVEEVFANHEIVYGSRKNDNGEIKYNKLRQQPADMSKRRISLNKVLTIKDELNKICANYEIFISHSVRDNSFSITIAILDADYERIQKDGFVKAENVDNVYPKMTGRDASAQGIKKFTSSKACVTCSDFRRHMIDNHYLCVTCFPENVQMLSLAKIRANVNANNQKALKSEREYNNVHKPIIMYGYRT